MRICVIGEGMVELSRAGDAWRMGHGGDTLNTAVHLARFGFDVAYVTALGADPFSTDLRAAWAGEGLDTGLILTDPNRRPGLYAITTDAAGERSFTYWRGDSAARGMFDLPGAEAVLIRVAQADLICFSLITLAILPSAAQRRLLDVCRHARARGGRVAFDGNYRPSLWAGTGEAAAARDAAIACCDIGLPTLADEALLSGLRTGADVARHWSGLGAGEVVVKTGAAGCWLAGIGAVRTPGRLEPVDTSGAGDAFNAGYLAARLRGAGLRDAALAGHRLAGWVVMRPGAIPARDRDAPYDAADFPSNPAVFPGVAKPSVAKDAGPR